MNRVECPECKVKFKVKLRTDSTTKACPACGHLLQVTRTTTIPVPPRHHVSMAEQRRAEYLQNRRD